MNQNTHASRGWFRSIDLWVMGPARFRCATLLFLPRSCSHGNCHRLATLRNLSLPMSFPYISSEIYFCHPGRRATRGSSLPIGGRERTPGAHSVPAGSCCFASPASARKFHGHSIRGKVLLNERHLVLLARAQDFQNRDVTNPSALTEYGHPKQGLTRPYQ